MQQLFSVNNGDTYLPTTVKDSAPADFAASTVKNSAQGAVILKLVNGANASRPVRIELAGAKRVPATAEFTVLAGPDANVVNDYGSPRTVLPQTKRQPLSASFDYEAPANSLTVIRITP